MASDWISREALLEELGESLQAVKGGTKWMMGAQQGLENAFVMVKKAPAVDAVEIVRCKNCANRGDFLECPLCVHDYNWSEEYQCMEHNFRDETEDDAFCHKGVRKDAVD